MSAIGTKRTSKSSYRHMSGTSPDCFPRDVSTLTASPRTCRRYAPKKETLCHTTIDGEPCLGHSQARIGPIYFLVLGGTTRSACHG